jgi:tetratricopeptide (TPR) repeat protein
MNSLPSQILVRYRPFMETVKFLLPFFLLLSLSTSGQSLLETKFNQSACNCIDKLNSTTAANYSNCIGQALESNHKLVYAQCWKVYNDTSTQSIFKIGKELYDKGSISMIYSCRSYFLLMDTLRYSKKLKQDKNSVRQEIGVLNGIDKSKWTKQFYSRRGILYFEIKILDSALLDFNKALELDKELVEIQYFKAWTLELQKNYNDAIAIYKHIFSITNRNEFKIFEAIATRKKNGL